jgi:hypothetical protein
MIKWKPVVVVVDDGGQGSKLSVTPTVTCVSSFLWERHHCRFWEDNTYQKQSSFAQTMVNQVYHEFNCVRHAGRGSLVEGEFSVVANIKLLSY